MATQQIPTVQNPGSPLDNLINSITKQMSGGSTTTETGGFSNQLNALLNNLVLGVGPYSKEQAITDALGPMQQLAQDTLQAAVPRSAAQVRGSGLYNSSTKALLDNDAQARLATQMAALVQKNITDYATINANNVNATANANRTNTTKVTTPTSNTSKQLLGALAPLLLGEGKKLAGSLFDDSTTSKAASTATDALGSLGSAVQSTVGNIGDFFGGANPLSSSSSDFLGDDGALGGLLGGGSDFGSDLLGGAGDLLGGLGSGIGDFFSNFSALLGNVGSNIGDIFGGLFEDGGVVPVRSAKTAAPDGEVKGPKSKTGRDNMLIGVQGGEGILHTGVMSQPGMAEFVESLNKAFAGAKGS